MVVTNPPCNNFNWAPDGEPGASVGTRMSTNRKHMIDSMAKRPSSFSLTRDPVKQPPKEVIKLLKKPDATSLEERTYRNRRTNFYKLVKERIEFAPRAVDEASQQVKDDYETVTGKVARNAERDAARARLIQRYPKEWARVCESIGKMAKPESSSSSDNKEKSTYLRCGSLKHLSKNIEPVHKKIPIKCAFMVNNLPTNIMHNFISYYGSPAVQQTILGGNVEGKSKAVSINLSAYDQSLLQAFKEKLMEKRGSDEKTAAKASEEAECNEALFDLSVAHLEDGDDVTDREIQERAEAILADTPKTRDWHSDTSLKDFQLNWSGWAQVDKWIVWAKNLFSLAWSIDAWWFRQPRTKYFLHHWFCLLGVGPTGNDVECHTVLETDRSPYDCPFMDKSGAEGHSKLDYLVRECLEWVFLNHREKIEEKEENEEIPPAAARNK
jgi:hypothetical protein